MEFNYTKDKNNIVTLTMDMAEKSANLIDEDYFKSVSYTHLRAHET